jgi:transcriptional regulator EpsA
MASLNIYDLIEEQRIVFMEVIEESLRVNNKKNLFNWLQRGIQFLIPHDVIVYGIRPSASEQFKFDYLSTSIEFSDKQFAMLISNETGVIQKAANQWYLNQKPILLAAKMQCVEPLNHHVIKMHSKDTIAMALQHSLMHGFGDTLGEISTMVMFGRINSSVHESSSYLLELLMPHLHCALVKVHTNNAPNPLMINQNSVSVVLTRRELEVLQWLHAGKTNWEISTILGVSPTTVKNHVQNTIRKLGVGSRGQAAIKGASLGLISTNQYNRAF